MKIFFWCSYNFVPTIIYLATINVCLTLPILRMVVNKIKVKIHQKALQNTMPCIYNQNHIISNVWVVYSCYYSLARLSLNLVKVFCFHVKVFDTLHTVIRIEF